MKPVCLSAAISAERMPARPSVGRVVGLWMVLSCVAGAAAMSGCGSSSAPAAPSPRQVSGAWLGEQTATAFADGECLAPVLQDIVGLPGQFHAAIDQSGTALSATLDIDHAGAVCTYSGTVEGQSVDLVQISCTQPTQGVVTCGNGARRSLRPLSERLHATLAAASLAGTAVEQDEVLDAETGRVVSVLQITGTFTLARR